MPEAPPRVLAVLPALFPSTIINVAKPLERLHQDRRIELDLTLQCVAAHHRVERADVVVLCHSLDPRFGAILSWIRDAGKPLIYDLDDNLLEAPADVPGLAYLREPMRRDLLVAALRQADRVRVYAPDLQRSLAAYTPRVSLVSGPLDWSLVPDQPPAGAPGRVRIVYATGRRQDRLGLTMLEPLCQVLDDCPQAELTIWGPRLDPLLHHPRVRFEPFVADYDRFFSRFARAGFDIGLAPLPDDAFHRGKSNLKFREYASCGIAGVYSDTPVYNTTVVDGETGLLVAERADAWRAALGRLIADATLRDRIARQARDQARRWFNQERTDDEWMGEIGALAGRPHLVPTSGLTASAGPAARHSLGTATALVRHLASLCRMVPRVVATNGIRSTFERAGAHASGLVQLTKWKLHHRHPRADARGNRGRS